MPFCPNILSNWDSIFWNRRFGDLLMEIGETLRRWAFRSHDRLPRLWLRRQQPIKHVPDIVIDRSLEPRHRLIDSSQPSGEFLEYGRKRLARSSPLHHVGFEAAREFLMVLGLDGVSAIDSQPVQHG